MAPCEKDGKESNEALCSAHSLQSIELKVKESPTSLHGDPKYSIQGPCIKDVRTEGGGGGQELLNFADK